MSYLELEISEQPQVIERLLARETNTAAQIADAVRGFKPAFVHIAARGTSDNAARYAQYLFGIHAHMPVALATPSVHTLYGTSPDLSRALVLGISQSGQSEDIRRVLDDARAQGALTVSITNDPASPLAQNADYHLDLGAGREVAVAATKSYTAQLAAVALLATALVPDSARSNELVQIPAAMRETLESARSIESWVARYRYIEHLAVIGRGYNYATAFEVAQKVRELCYITCEEYSEADFRHGPIAIIDRGYPVMVIAPQGKPSPLLLDLLAALQERGAECLVVTNDPRCDPYARYRMALPDVPEWLSPLVAILPGQVFAMNLTRERDLPLDQPRGLTKVTNTN